MGVSTSPCPLLPGVSGRQWVCTRHSAHVVAILHPGRLPGRENLFRADSQTPSPSPAEGAVASQPSSGAAGGPAPEGKEWKSRAAQLIYNRKTGAWAATDKAVVCPTRPEVGARGRGAPLERRRGRRRGEARKEILQAREAKRLGGDVKLRAQAVRARDLLPPHRRTPPPSMHATGHGAASRPKKS